MKRIPVFLAGAYLCLAPAGAAYHKLVCVNWGELSTGEEFLQLQLAVVLAEGESWRGSECSIFQIGGGEPISFYQNPLNDMDPPYWPLFSTIPDSEYTSYYTAPHLWPNSQSSGSVSVMQREESSDSLYAEWYAASPTSGPGEFVIAQFTILGGPGQYDLSITSTLDPAPTITGSGGYCTCHVPCGVLSPQSISYGPWTPGEASTSARIPRGGGVTYENAVIEGPNAADFAVEVLPGPGDVYDVKFQPTDYGYREATLVLTGSYQDPWMPEPVPWTNNIPLTGYGLCFGDLNGDAVVGLSDLAQLLSNYGRFGWELDYFDGNLVEFGGIEFIDVQDLAELLSLYGTTCE